MKAAEQARLAYLGANQAECVPWDELKPEMCERWAGVVDAAQKPICAELDAAKARVAELEAMLGKSANNYLQMNERVVVVGRDNDDLRAQLEDMAAEQDAMSQQLAILHPGETVDGVVMERDSLLIQLDHAKQDIAAAQAECKHLNAVIADMQPVDPDAWKMPLEIQSMIIETHKMRAFHYEDGFQFAIWNDGSRVNCTISPADAARVAVHLASYAAAHGCPVVLPAPTESEVEALARVLLDEHNEWCSNSRRQEPMTDALARAAYERAYFAALGGLAGLDGLADVETVYHAQHCALETVRQWPAMMAELEQEIAK